MGRKAVHLIPGSGKVGRLPNFMKTLTRLTVLFVTLVSLVGFAVPTGFAQESIISASFPTPSSPKEKLHALQSTRFHFITLKQFHSALFSFGENQNTLSNSEAEILNAGLNAFLSSPRREIALLEALRQNKAIQLKFSVSQQEEAYDIVDNPNKPLLYQLKPLLKSVPASIEVRPLLDRPVAFQITLKKGNEHYSYYVDWAGKITHLA